MTDDDGPDGQWLKNYVKYLDAVSAAKARMVERHLTVAKCTCPKCGVRDAMIIRLTPQRRDRSGFHARWACETEGCGFSGME